MAAKTYVVANRDFIYTTDLPVKRGQVFVLADAPNDALLLKHRHVTLLDPQPKAASLAKMPVCGECGRIFLEEHWRNRCGRLHELSSAEVRQQRRADAQGRVDEVQRINSRTVLVGA